MQYSKNRSLKSTVRKVVAISLFATLFNATRTNAQTVLQRGGDFVIDFRWDRSVIDPGYMHTGEHLQALSDSINNIGILRIDSLNVVSWASPEGRFGYNTALSKRRAEAMSRYLHAEYPELSDKMHFDGAGESWHLFRARALKDTTLTPSQRERILSIIDSKAAPDQKKQQLKDYDIALWRQFIDEWFLDMRRSFIHLSWKEYREASVLPVNTPFRGAVTSSGTVLHPISYDWWEYKTILALKTNLLYDAVTALNFEVEVPIGDKFSIMVEDVFPWWAWGPNDRKYCFQMWEIGLEPRWWFSRTPARDRLSGHFIAPYAMSSKYDFQNNLEYCWQGEYWSAGLTYGFACPLGKYFNMEFSASVGYLNTDWRHYQPDAPYEHLIRDPYKTGNTSYFGPTKLKVSLVAPIMIKYKRTAR